MVFLRTFIKTVVILAVLVGGSFVFFKYYSIIFSKTVTGEVSEVQRLDTPTTVLGGSKVEIPNYQLFSFAVSIRTVGGEIFTSSSEDRQWAVVQNGQCVEAKLFPYPPWDFESSGTYHNARLIRIFDCVK